MTPAEIANLPPYDRPMAHEIARRGLRAIFNGNAWHVSGPGVDVTVIKLRYLTTDNLKPPRPPRD